jgi:hypothetical protein
MPAINFPPPVAVQLSEVAVKYSFQKDGMPSFMLKDK